MATVGELCGFEKKAGGVGDFVRGIGTHSLLGVIPFAGPAVNIGDSVSSIVGMADKVSEEDKRETVNNPNKSFIPFIGSYRRGKRLRGVADESLEDGGNHPYANLIAEQLGIVPATLLAAGAGAGIGGLIGSGSRGSATVPQYNFDASSPNYGNRMADKLIDLGPNTSRYAFKGIVAGAGLAGAAGIVALLAAAIRRRRTMKEQAEKETTGRAVAKYIVPGLSTYDSFKRYGRSLDWDTKYKEPKKDKNPPKSN